METFGGSEPRKAAIRQANPLSLWVDRVLKSLSPGEVFRLAFKKMILARTLMGSLGTLRPRRVQPTFRIPTHQQRAPMMEA